MLKTSILVAVRQLLKRPASILLNILGLSVGIVTFVLLILYVQVETSYDTFHTDSEHIYRVVNNYKTDNEFKHSAWTSPALVFNLEGKVPEITEAVRLFRYRSPSVISNNLSDKSFTEEYSVWADPNIFRVFDFKFIVGDPNAALMRPNTMVITKSVAQRYFDDVNPIGKVLSDYTMRADFEITGIVEDMPSTSHFRADLISSLITLPTVWNPTIMTDWSNNFLYSYVKTDGSSSIENLNEKINNALKPSRPDNEVSESFHSLQPITDIHLKSHIQNEWTANSDIKYIQILGLVGILILLVATINYVNLWIARSLQRKREIGIRKAIGSSKMQLIRHFIVDNVMQIILALVISGAIVSVCQPAIASLFGSDIQWMSVSSWKLLLGICLGVIAFSIVVMLYPAILISRIQVTQAMKSKSIKIGKGIGVWKGLVAFQVLVTTMLITSALLVNKQLGFMQDQPIGYEAKQIINIAQVSDSQLRTRLKDDLLRNPLVNNASGVSHQVGGILYQSRYTVHTQDGQTPKLWQRIHADHDFSATYGVPIVAGRDFSELIASDTSNFLINEAACRDLGVSPEEAIGMEVGENSSATGKIIGVFRDFHFKSLHSEIEPLVVHIVPDRVRMLSVNINTSNSREAIASLQSVWNKLNPAIPFTYSFLAEYNERSYQQEQKFSKLILLFTIIVICLSASGLVSLNIYIVNLKRKEIGIRKVHGADLPSVLLDLCKSFVTITIVSFLISIPISWYLLDNWLSLFAYHVELTVWLFVIAGITSMVISMLSIALPSIKAASEDVVKILNVE